ncbi:MAG TPA: hypothetical protein DCM86_17675 [Verrucomicrobiales bacterium]|nr:hypothetical protein [Verrucomicrobiales bacterium]
MKTLTALFAALVLTMSLSARAGLTDLEAISLIESGGNDYAVGDAGEVSRYQILPKVWRSYTRSHEYQNRWLAGEVAKRHLSTLQQSFQREAGRAPGDFELYVLWNAGLDYYRRHGFSPRRVASTIRERADRFVNLKNYLTPNRHTEQARVGN